MTAVPNVEPVGTARVLIVDDERRNRDLLEVMLQSEGYLLETAASGDDAIVIVAQRRPALILLDVMMPGMDGYQVTAKLKGDAATNAIRILLLTSLDDQNSRAHGLRAGADGVLTKPVNRAELCERVRSLLRSTNPPAASHT
jgi:DNA-binding response OmpR family regulator